MKSIDNIGFQGFVPPSWTINSTYSRDNKNLTKLEISNIYKCTVESWIRIVYSLIWKIKLNSTNFRTHSGCVPNTTSIVWHEKIHWIQQILEYTLVAETINPNFTNWVRQNICLFPMSCKWISQICQTMVDKKLNQISLHIPMEPYGKFLKDVTNCIILKARSSSKSWQSYQRWVKAIAIWRATHS